MKTIHITNKPTQEQIGSIVYILGTGGVIIFPTDTSYGLGADATNEEAIRKIFAIKGRDYKKPLHIIVSDIEMAKKYAIITPIARKLFVKFFPGPVTFVVPKKENLPDLLTAGLATVGIRIPDHPVPRMIVESFGKPITATSANVSGEPDRYDVKQLEQELGSRLGAHLEAHQKPDLVIDAGTLPRVQPSTIIAIENNDVKLIRKGPLSFRAVQEFVNDQQL